jgi:hypothetical protein
MAVLSVPNPTISPPCPVYPLSASWHFCTQSWHSLGTFGIRLGTFVTGSWQSSWHFCQTILAIFLALLAPEAPGQDQTLRTRASREGTPSLEGSRLSAHSLLGYPNLVAACHQSYGKHESEHGTRCTKLRRSRSPVAWRRGASESGQQYSAYGYVYGHCRDREGAAPERVGCYRKDQLWVEGSACWQRKHEKEDYESRSIQEARGRCGYAVEEARA